MAEKSISIYLASPLGFTPYGNRYAREVVELTTQKGMIPLDPWSSIEGAELGRLIDEGAGTEDLERANEIVGAANLLLIDACDGILACLDGTSVDDGTAAEIGYGVGIGRVVVGYRTDLRASGDNAATLVNLQITHLITRSGGAIYSSPQAGLDHLMLRLSR